MVVVVGGVGGLMMGGCGFDPWPERRERLGVGEGGEGGGGRNRLKSISVSVPPLYYRRSASKTPVILEKGACGRLYKYTLDPTESEWADNDLHA